MEFCIVYVSSSNGLTDLEVRDLSLDIQRRNYLLGITGILLFCNGSIIQVLEGNQSAVSALFEKISIDTRHRQVTKIYCGTVPERSFPKFSMGFKTVSDNEMLALTSQIPALNNPSLLTKSERMITSLVKTFYKNNYRN